MKQHRRQVTFEVDEEFLTKLHNVAQRRGCTLQELIRLSLEYFISMQGYNDD